MTNILIRGLSEMAVASIDAEASALGLSRDELLRRKLEMAATLAHGKAAVTAVDWECSSRTFGDLMNDDVMNAAWQ